MDLNKATQNIYRKAILLALVAPLLNCNLAPQDRPAGDLYSSPGQKLLFSAYTLREPELSQAKANGFTAIGPYYGRDKPLALDYAKQANLPVIYSVGPKIDFANTTEESDSAVLEEIVREVRRVGQSPDIAIWNLGNEELKFWRSREMAWLRKVTDAIRANDPQQRPIMMYEPNHRNSEQLEITGRYLDIVSKGTYVNYVRMKSSRSWLRWSMEQTVDAAKQTGGTPIAVLWMARDQESEADIAAIQASVRHDVYLSLTSGAKGIIVFSAFNRRKGFRKHFTDFFEAYAQTARELNVTLNLGQVFLYGDSAEDIRIEVTEGPTVQSFTYQDETHSYPSIHYLHTIFEQQHYLFMINSANQPVTATISGHPVDAQLYDVFSGTTTAIDTNLRLEALEVKAIRWQ